MASNLLVANPSVDGPTFYFGNGGVSNNVATFFPAMGETASGAASQWYVSEWSLANYINPANVVVDGNSNVDPVYGFPIYNFSNSDDTQSLSAYQAANGTWIYGLTADNDSLGNAVGGADLFLSTALMTPITLNNTVNYSVDLRETSAVSGVAPAFAFTGFTLSFNVAGTSNYDATLPTISMFLQIDITDSRGANTMVDYDTASVSADGKSITIIAAGILPEDPSLSFGVQNTTYDVSYSSLNIYMTNFLQQTFLITQASGSSSFGTLNPAVLNLADWTLNGVYIGTEDDGTGPVTLSSSQLGLQVSDLLLSTTTAAPTIGGSMTEVPNTAVPASTSPAIVNGTNQANAGPPASTVISGYYQTVLGRNADASGLATWGAAVNFGMTYAQVQAELADSAEGQSDVSNLYQAVLGRPADTAGLANYVGYLASIGTLAGVRTALADSAEAQSDVSNLYQAVLGRPADTGGLANFVGYLASTGTLAGVRTALADSAEAQSDVSNLYQAVLGRPADTGGLANFVGYLASTGTLAGVRTALADSAEAQSDVSNLYQAVLGRPADTAGLANYVGYLASTGTLAGVRTALADSAEAQSDVSNLYQAVLGRPADTGGLANFVGYLASTGTLAGVRTALVDSAEAQSDVSNLYQAVLGRPADTAGLANYVGYLASTGTLAGVRTALADSAEGQAKVTTVLQTDTGSTPTAGAITAGQTQLADGLSLADLNTQTLNLASNPTSFLDLTGGTTSFAGTGVATFGLGPGSFGQNTIVGFDPAKDILELSQTQFPTFGSVQADLSQTINGALITFDSSNTILLEGISTSNLANADYRFV